MKRQRGLEGVPGWRRPPPRCLRAGFATKGQAVAFSSPGPPRPHSRCPSGTGQPPGRSPARGRRTRCLPTRSRGAPGQVHATVGGPFGAPQSGSWESGIESAPRAKPAPLPDLASRGLEPPNSAPTAPRPRFASARGLRLGHRAQSCPEPLLALSGPEGSAHRPPPGRCPREADTAGPRTRPSSPCGFLQAPPATYGSCSAASPTAAASGPGCRPPPLGPTARGFHRCSRPGEAPSSPRGEETLDSPTGQCCAGGCLRPWPRPRARSSGCSQGGSQARPPPPPRGPPRVAARRAGVTCGWSAGRLLLRPASRSQQLPAAGPPEREERERLSRAPRRPRPAPAGSTAGLPTAPQLMPLSDPDPMPGAIRNLPSNALC